MLSEQIDTCSNVEKEGFYEVERIQSFYRSKDLTVVPAEKLKMDLLKLSSWFSSTSSFIGNARSTHIEAKARCGNQYADFYDQCKQESLDRYESELVDYENRLSVAKLSGDSQTAIVKPKVMNEDRVKNRAEIRSKANRIVEARAHGRVKAIEDWRDGLKEMIHSIKAVLKADDDERYAGNQE